MEERQGQADGDWRCLRSLGGWLLLRFCILRYPSPDFVLKFWSSRHILVVIIDMAVVEQTAFWLELRMEKRSA